jgi:hypothetical protein
MGIQRSSASAFSIDFKKADDLVRREVLYNIVIEFGVPMKLLWTGLGWLRIGTGGGQL